MFILKLFAGSYTRRTSIGKWLSLMSCSEPRLSSDPQWKWNCFARQMSPTPPPEIVINLPVKSICTVTRITVRIFWMIVWCSLKTVYLNYIFVGQRSFLCSNYHDFDLKINRVKTYRIRLQESRKYFITEDYNCYVITVVLCHSRRWHDKETLMFNHRGMPLWFNVI